MNNSYKKSDLKQVVVTQSPGRINLIGDHTDYNDGFVLPAAVDKKIITRLQRNGSLSTCQVEATNVKECFSFDLSNYAPLEGGWQNYIMGVVNELQQLGGEIQGFDCEFEGNVPIGGGMSSSAALECSLAYGLNELFELGMDKWQLIKASQMAEHNFVGIKCGIMDQFASMMGKKDQVMLLDCRSLKSHYYPLDLGDYELLLLNTNVSHTLASSAYNTRRSECEQGGTILKKTFPQIKKLRDVTLAQLLSQQTHLPSKIFRRCRHVVSENQRVLDATAALQEGNLENLGRLIYQSHFSLRDDYEVSCLELDFLVQETIGKDYVLGSRMMGGGFGGCTINIIEKSKKKEFVEEISEKYQQRHGMELTPYSVSIENGTSIFGGGE